MSQSDSISVCESNRNLDDLHSLDDISNFLDITYKKFVKVCDYFSDTDRFVKSVDILKRLVGFDLLDEEKRFRLKKHLTTLRKEKNSRPTQKPKVLS